MSYTASAALAALILAVAPLVLCRLLDCCLNVVHTFMVARGVGERRWDDTGSASVSLLLFACLLLGLAGLAVTP